MSAGLPARHPVWTSPETGSRPFQRRLRVRLGVSRGHLGRCGLGGLAGCHWGLRGVNSDTDESAGPESPRVAFEGLRLRQSRRLRPIVGLCALSREPLGTLGRRTCLAPRQAGARIQAQGASLLGPKLGAREGEREGGRRRPSKAARGRHRPLPGPASEARAPFTVLIWEHGDCPH